MATRADTSQPRVTSGSFCKPLASARPSHIAQTQLFGEDEKLWRQPQAAFIGRDVTVAPKATLALDAMT